MIRRLLNLSPFLVVLLLLTSACADWLPRQEDEVTVVPFGSENANIPLSTATATPTATPTATAENERGANPVATNTPFPSATPARQNNGGGNNDTVANGGGGCTIRSDWPTYTIRQGDTLSTIASRAGTDLSTLVTGNCLANPDLIEVGQVLRVPNAIAAPESIQYYLIAEDGRAGTTVGCGDRAVPIETGISITNDPAVNVQRAMAALIGFEGGQVGLSSALSLQGSAPPTATLNNGLMRVDIPASLILVGVCGDARMRAQLLLTAFQFEGFDQLQIFFNGQNFAQMIDMSGQAGADAVFNRNDQP